MKILLLICSILALLTQADRQDSESVNATEHQNLANSLNLRLHTMQVALGETRNLKSNLELVESQRDSLESLSKDYAQMVESLMKLEKEDSEFEKNIALCLRKMNGFEERLSSDILLPHQYAELRRMVFAKLVSENNDDWFETLSTYYPADFTLSRDQQFQMNRIKQTATMEIANARKEFEQKLRTIRDAARNDVHRVLTPKQSKLLVELSGHPVQQSRK